MNDANAPRNAQPDAPADDQTLLQQVKTELEELKAVASAFGPERIRDGSWFNEFLHAMLDTYSRRIIEGGGIALFRKKYPGMTQKEIAEKLCDLAVRYAALAGGSSGLASSAAVVMTIGTAGGAGVVTVPAAVTAIGAEMLFTTRLQVRLVYDLSMVYGYPIDVEDPEDLYKAFCLAYGIVFAASSAGTVTKALTPEIARAQIRGLIQGHTAAIQQVAIRILGPRIGRQISQKAILRTAVPVIGVGISSAWNYASTRNIGIIANHELRSMGRLRDAVRELSTALTLQTEASTLVLESIFVVAAADGVFEQHEQEVYQCVLKHLDVPQDTLKGLEERVDITASSIEARLRELEAPELRKALAECLKLVAVADGKLEQAELELLSKLLPALGEELVHADLEGRASFFRRPETVVSQATRVIRDAATKAGEGIGAVGRSVSAMATGLFGRKKDAQVDEPVVTTTPENEAAEAEAASAAIRALATLHAEGALTDLEFQEKKKDLLARL